MNFGPVMTLAVAAGLSGLVFGTMLMASVVRWDGNGKEAPLTFHPDGNADHVSLSLWRLYLDVNEYQLALRADKMWFNA